MPKLRIRLLKATKVITFENDTTLADVKTLAEEQFPLLQSGTYHFSLNGCDKLFEESTKLSDLGIVSGDLLHILLNDDELAKHQTSNPAPASANPASNPAPTSTNQAANPAPASANQAANPAPSSANQAANPTPSSSDERTSVPTKVRCIEPTTSNENRSEERNIQRMDVDTEQNEESAKEALQQINRYLNEPMICRDATVTSVPASLQQAYEDADVRSRADAVCVLLHVLMGECGYQVGEERRNSSEAACSVRDVGTTSGMPTIWRSRGGCYQLTYIHPSCPAATCSLTCVTMGNVLAVNGVVIEASEAPNINLQIKFDQFVCSASDALSTYKDLSRISRIFKDSIAQPLLQALQLSQGLEAANFSGIMGLGQEVKLKILSYLDVRSLVRISKVCQMFYSISRDPYLWRRLFLWDFGSRGDNSLSQNWYKLYSQLREIRKRMTFVVPNPASWRQPPHPLPPPFAPPIHPGIVGGDYDLYPGGLPRNIFHPRAPNPLFPLRPRFDPFGPGPDHQMFPGRGGGMRDGRHPPGGRFAFRRF